MKIIHTGLFSDNAFNLLKCIKFSILNGNRSKSSYAMNVSNFKKDMNNEIVVEINDSSYEYKYSMFFTFDRNNSNFTKVFLDFLANQLKIKIIKTLLVKWDRNNVEKITMHTAHRESFESSIQDVYYVYDVLKGRKNLKNKYPADVIARMHGEEYDPILTEQNKIVHDEILKLEEEMKNKLKENRDIFNDKYHKIWEDKENIDIQIKKDFDLKKSELLNSIELIKNMTSAA